MISDELSIAASAQEPGRWEIAYQWRVLWRTLKWSVSGVIVFLALLAVGQIYLFHQMFSGVHPVLGWVFVAAVSILFFWLIGVPLIKFLHAPKLAQPPDVNLKADKVDPSALKHRLNFDDAYLKSMCQNPALGDVREKALTARADLQALEKQGGDDLPARLLEFEHSRIAILLKDLDRQVDDYIHKEALAVGSATAMSMNGSIDAFVVLWRNINMISRISRLYYGRPSMRLSLRVLRDVMAAVLLSRALDDISDIAGDAFGRTISRLGGLVVGPLMDGSVNALVTLKLGYLAKRRCRSFDRWSRSSALKATQEVFERVKKESGSLTGELVRLSGDVFSTAGRATGRVATFATDAAGNVFAAPKSAWSLVQDRLMRKPAPKGKE